MARKAKETAENTENNSTTAADKREVFRMDDNATITFGVDKDGKAYSPENSPKKGDATKARWALYTEGMTLAEAVSAGLTRSNIRKDRRAKFVVITNPAKVDPEKADA